MPDEDDDLPPEEMKRLSGIVPDIVRRAVLTGSLSPSSGS